MPWIRGSRAGPRKSKRGSAAAKGADSKQQQQQETAEGQQQQQDEAQPPVESDTPWDPSGQQQQPQLPSTDAQSEDQRQQQQEQQKQPNDSSSAAAAAAADADPAAAAAADAAAEGAADPAAAAVSFSSKLIRGPSDLPAWLQYNSRGSFCCSSSHDTAGELEAVPLFAVSCCPSLPAAAAAAAAAAGEGSQEGVGGGRGPLKGDPLLRRGCAVCVRIRPESLEEARTGAPCCIEFVGPPAGGPPGEGRQDLVVRGLRQQLHRFSFSRIFSETASQAEVFSVSCLPVVRCLFEGLSGAVIAYGQTGSGKTYTMLGPLDQPGGPPELSSGGPLPPLTKTQRALYESRRGPASQRSSMLGEQQLRGGAWGGGAPPGQGRGGPLGARGGGGPPIPFLGLRGRPSYSEGPPARASILQQRGSAPRAGGDETGLSPYTQQAGALGGEGPTPSPACAPEDRGWGAPPQNGGLPLDDTDADGDTLLRRHSAQVTDLRGIMPRVIEEVFRSMEALRGRDNGGGAERERGPPGPHSPEGAPPLLPPHWADPKEATDVQLTATLVELYNERILDLLDPSRGPLSVREAPDGHTFVAEATEIHLQSYSQALRLLRRGLRGRACSTTAANLMSSRSHALLTLTLQQQKKAQGRIAVSQVNLVDLAGSERGDAAAEGQRLQETQSINRSLLALSKVVNALAGGPSRGPPPSSGGPHTTHAAALRGSSGGGPPFEGSRGSVLRGEGPSLPAVAGGAPRKRHVPYRESKLTRLLQKSLGGSALAVLIICCSPHSRNLQETLSALRFGDRASNIENKPAPQDRISLAALQEQLKDTTQTLRMYEACLRSLRVAVGQQQQAICLLQNLVPQGAPVTAEEIRLLKAAKAAAKEAILADAAAHLSGAPRLLSGSDARSSTLAGGGGGYQPRPPKEGPPPFAASGKQVAAAAPATEHSSRRSLSSSPTRRSPFDEEGEGRTSDKRSPRASTPEAPRIPPRGPRRAPANPRNSQAAAAAARGVAAVGAALRRKELEEQQQRHREASWRAAAERQARRASGSPTAAAAATGPQQQQQAAAAQPQKEEASVNWLPQARDPQGLLHDTPSGAPGPP
ncbi:hypothetical protein Efla_002805 [Eimeria flavescens]